MKKSNKTHRLTQGLMDLTRLLNPQYEYQMNMNPKRTLTVYQEGETSNNGYDNAESDYILRVNESIFSPEGRE